MTVAELLELLMKFDPATPVQFQSHDGPDYGFLEIGPQPYPGEPEATISNEGLE